MQGHCLQQDCKFRYPFVSVTGAVSASRSSTASGTELRCSDLDIAQHDLNGGEVILKLLPSAAGEALQEARSLTFQADRLTTNRRASSSASSMRSATLFLRKRTR